MNAANEAFVKRWKATTWAKSDNQAAVSEDFVTPPLPRLGYTRESVNAALRKRSFLLPQLFLQVARRRIQIDYLNKVNLKKLPGTRS
jgi:hypothetical protein